MSLPSLFGAAYRGRRVLVTGHTGFKGSWLTLWLKEMGAEVSGVALAPETTPSHWNGLRLDTPDNRFDIGDATALQQAVTACQPEIVFHLAAQPLVRRSYGDPLGTWSTNVMGTANLMEACRHTSSVRAIVAVTTDKCYRNREWAWGYRETDELGGYDPYSASKAGAELVVASYRDSFLKQPGGALVATARAGNVIGGGDWSEDRLIPDLVRALSAGRPLEVRSPAATRPWQHVLESLSGYLLLGQRMLQGDAQCAKAWNFGPAPEGNRSVAEVLAGLEKHWPELRWQVTGASALHEANLLYLDSSLARKELGWQPVWDFERTLAMTARWYRDYYASGSFTTATQLADYVAAARQAGIAWAAA